MADDESVSRRLSELCDSASSADSKVRVQLVSDILDLVDDSHLPQSLPLGVARAVVDALASCAQDSNVRVSESALRGLSECLPSLWPHCLTPDADETESVSLAEVTLQQVAERLGDSRPGVRDSAAEVFVSVMGVAGVSAALKVLMSCLSHKNYRVKEQALRLLRGAVEEHGRAAHPVQAHVGGLLGLLEDSNPSVRKECNLLLEELYRRMGGRLQKELELREIRPAILRSLTQQLEAVPLADEADMFPSPEPKGSKTPARRSAAAPAGTAGLRAKTPPSRPAGSGTIGTGSGHRTVPSSKASSSSPSSLSSSKGAADIKAVRVTSDRQLMKEFEDIANALSSLENDWSERVKAMRRLQAMLAGGAHLLPSFVPAFALKVKEPLAAQCLDLRSSAVKEVTACIEALSVALGDALEPVTDHFVDVLMKLVAVANRLMSDYGNQAMRVMLEHCRVNRGIGRMIETITGSKNNVQRQRAAEFLCVILSQAERYRQTGTLDRMVEQIEGAIVTGVTDSTPAVRTASRASYWVYAGLWRDRGERLLASLDGGIRKLIYDEHDRARKAPGLSSTMTSLSSTVAADMILPAGAKRRQLPSNELASFTAVKQLNVASHSDPVSTVVSSSDVTRAFAKPAKLPNKGVDPGALCAALNASRQVEPSNERKSARTVGHPAVADSSSSAALDAIIPSRGSRSGSQKKAGSASSGQFSPPSAALSSFRLVSQQAGKSHQQQEPQQQSDLRASPVFFESEQSPIPRLQDGTPILVEDAADTPKSPLSGRLAGTSTFANTEAILAAAESVEWMVRRAAVVALQKALDGSNQQIVYLDLVSKVDMVISIIIRRLDDTNEQVLKAVLDLFRSALRAFSGQMRSKLLLLLPPLFLLHSRSDRTIRPVVTERIKQICAQYEPNASFTAVLSVAEGRGDDGMITEGTVVHPLVIQECVAMYMMLLDKYPEYLTCNKNARIRDHIAQFGALLCKNIGEAEQSLEVAVNRLYSLSPEAVVQAVSQMSGTRSDAKRALLNCCSALKDAVARARRTSACKDSTVDDGAPNRKTVAAAAPPDWMSGPRSSSPEAFDELASVQRSPARQESASAFSPSVLPTSTKSAFSSRTLGQPISPSSPTRTNPVLQQESDRESSVREIVETLPSLEGLSALRTAIGINGLPLGGQLSPAVMNTLAALDSVPDPELEEETGMAVSALETLLVILSNVGNQRMALGNLLRSLFVGVVKHAKCQQTLATRVLRAMVEVADPEQLTNALMAVVKEEAVSTTIVNALSYLRQLPARTPERAIPGLLKLALSNLGHLMNHEEPVVRKELTIFIAELVFFAKDKANDLLESLPMNSRKLLKFYTDKRAAKK